jgi:hypothetical protein
MFFFPFPLYSFWRQGRLAANDLCGNFPFRPPPLPPSFYIPVVPPQENVPCTAAMMNGLLSLCFFSLQPQPQLELKLICPPQRDKSPPSQSWGSHMAFYQVRRSRHWSREYQLSSSSSYSYYQMRLCRLWSRNAENSSVLFYVVTSRRPYRAFGRHLTVQ